MSTAPHTGMEFEHGNEAAPSWTTDNPPGAQESGMVKLVLFAGVIMILVGIFEVIMGLTAAFFNGYFEATKDPLVTANYDVWGWVHVALGTVAIVAGAGLFRGKLWARILGILFALSCAVVNLGFIAVAPVWSVSVITMCVLIVWAIIVHGEELSW